MWRICVEREWTWGEGFGARWRGRNTHAGQAASSRITKLHIKRITKQPQARTYTIATHAFHPLHSFTTFPKSHPYLSNISCTLGPPSRGTTCKSSISVNNHTQNHIRTHAKFNNQSKPTHIHAIPETRQRSRRLSLLKLVFEFDLVRSKSVFVV